MRILQVITDTDRRGAQVFALDLEAALRDLGHAVETVALAPGAVGGLPVPALGPGRRAPRALAHLRARMRAADVSVAHGSSTGPACALAGVGLRAPFVYRQISDSRFWAPTRAKRARVRAVLRRARVVVALSAFNRRDLVDWIGLPAERVRVIPNGVVGSRFPPGTPEARAAARRALGLPDAPLVAMVGALAPEKGADLAVRGVASIDGAHLLVAGDGPERARLEALAATVAPGRIHFAGSIPDAVTAYHAADAVVLPSRGGDAMPAVLIEAGCCGLASVTTDIGAIGEVVLDGRTGVVVAPGDGAAFTAALAALMADPARRAAMGSAARAHCLAHFDIQPVARAWVRVLAEAAGVRPSG